MVSEILTFFVLCKNPRCPPKNDKNFNFSNLHGLHLYYPVGQKFCQNRSTSYGFRDINIFCLRKNPRWPPKILKIKILKFHTG